MTMTTKKIQEIRKDMEQMAEIIESKHGVVIDFGSARYTSEDFRMKLEVTEVGKDMGTDEAKKEKFIKDSQSKGHDIGHLYGATIVLRGKEYEVTSFNKNSPKNCMGITKKENGVQYKCSLGVVESNLK